MVRRNVVVVDGDDGSGSVAGRNTALVGRWRGVKLATSHPIEEATYAVVSNQRSAMLLGSDLFVVSVALRTPCRRAGLADPIGLRLSASAAQVLRPSQSSSGRTLRRHISSKSRRSIPERCQSDKTPSLPGVLLGVCYEIGVVVRSTALTSWSAWFLPLPDDSATCRVDRSWHRRLPSLPCVGPRARR